MKIFTLTCVHSHLTKDTFFLYTREILRTSKQATDNSICAFNSIFSCESGPLCAESNVSNDNDHANNS